MTTNLSYRVMNTLEELKKALKQGDDAHASVLLDRLETLLERAMDRW